jgi:hypothetical protein
MPKNERPSGGKQAFNNHLITAQDLANRDHTTSLRESERDSILESDLGPGYIAVVKLAAERAKLKTVGNGNVFVEVVENDQFRNEILRKWNFLVAN